VPLLLLWHPRPFGAPVVLDAILTGEIAYGRAGQIEDNAVLSGDIDSGGLGHIDRPAFRGEIASSIGGEIEE
jgi:hypothetical protein